MSSSVAYSPVRRPLGAFGQTGPALGASASGPASASASVASGVAVDLPGLDTLLDPFVQPIRRISIVAARANRRARPKVFYAAVIVAGLGVVMLSQLMMSIALSDGAYTINRLMSDQKSQARSIQALTEELGTLSSPQNLAANAESLGMVQNTNPVWLRMSDGAVIGTPTAAAPGTGAIGAAGSQVPNELLTGIPLVTGQ
ncbi:hypothetical protein [Naasia lichenicola]|uniref:Cell division protein FtsL n=1 Tax=Naasia lichenicola TaxID=2565933 RepID=A0A4S4FT18_9MICO|nr:hypothetical protein [Naasia lichenicola]THG33468.1 hypothetical protein E6C64_03780 [Naasia lichenicola]